MGKSQLSVLEIRDLIDRYQSEIRKLEYQIDKTKSTILELESQISPKSSKGKSFSYTNGSAEEVAYLSEAEGESAPEPMMITEKPATAEKKSKAGRRGRPPKKDNQTAKAKTPGKRGRPVKEKGDKAKPKKEQGIIGYRLNDWDKTILNGIEVAEKALDNHRLLELLQQKRDNDQLAESDDNLKSLLNRSLHKLANKKKMLIKLDKEGRGFSYGLASWLKKNGEMPKKYLE